MSSSIIPSHCLGLGRPAWSRGSRNRFGYNFYGIGVFCCVVSVCSWQLCQVVVLLYLGEGVGVIGWWSRPCPCLCGVKGTWQVVDRCWFIWHFNNKHCLVLRLTRSTWSEELMNGLLIHGVQVSEFGFQAPTLLSISGLNKVVTIIISHL